jgi:hypothetical protein
VALPTFNPEIRKLTQGLVDEFDYLQVIMQNSFAINRAPLDPRGPKSMSRPQEQCSKRRFANQAPKAEISASSERSLELIKRCQQEASANRGAFPSPHPLNALYEHGFPRSTSFRARFSYNGIPLWILHT